MKQSGVNYIHCYSQYGQIKNLSMKEDCLNKKLIKVDILLLMLKTLKIFQKKKWKDKD